MAVSAPLVQCFEGIRVIFCWPHLVRELTKPDKLALANDKDWVQASLKPAAQQLHLCRSEGQHGLLGKLCLDWWEADEPRYMEWFSNSLLTPPWNMWFATCSGLPGVTPSQQVRSILAPL